MVGMIGEPQPAGNTRSTECLGDVQLLLFYYRSSLQAFNTQLARMHRWLILAHHVRDTLS